jgi:hypothetical protein
MATGFTLDKIQKQWHSAHFKDNSKYIVSKATTREYAREVGEYAWEVKEVGAAMPVAFCKDNFTRAGSLDCRGILAIEFRMNKNNLRFLVSSFIGYWTDNIKGWPK